jgi:enoyl-CoA hydratase
MPESLTTIEENEGMVLLTLNRSSKRNALSRALREEIVSRLDAFEKDEQIRSVVLTGSGPAFCAGFDRDELASGAMEEIFADANEYHRRVFTFAKPLIAAVNGPALGGGCDLAAMCDFRIAAPSAVFGQPQVRFGAAASYELMRGVLGSGHAREMCLTGRSYDAAESLSIGFVNRVVPADELLAVASELGTAIASLPEGVASNSKRAFVTHQPDLF